MRVPRARDAYADSHLQRLPATRRRASRPVVAAPRPASRTSSASIRSSARSRIRSSSRPACCRKTRVLGAPPAALERDAGRRRPAGCAEPRAEHAAASTRTMALTSDRDRTLFAAKGDRMYTGEPVTQLEHALQTRAARRRRQAPMRPWSSPRCCTTSATCSTTRARRRPCAASTTCTSSWRCRSCAGCSTTRCWRRSACTSTPSATCACATADRRRLLGRAVGRLEAQPRTAGRRLHAAPRPTPSSRSRTRRTRVRVRVWDDLAKQCRCGHAAVAALSGSGRAHQRTRPSSPAGSRRRREPYPPGRV